MQEINLEEILAKWVSYNLQQLGRSKQESETIAKISIEGGSHWYILEAMKEACKQALELAAENAEGDIVDDSDFSNGRVVIDKQSILDTINQVK